MLIRLTKTGGPSGVCVFGRYAKGAHLDIRVPDKIANLGEQEAKIRARAMMQRGFPDESQVEWEAEIVDS